MRDSLSPVANTGWDARIQVYACGSLVQVFVIQTQRYVVIVDPLFNGETARALLELVRPSLAGRPLLVILSHADWDHAWGSFLFTGPDAEFPSLVIGSAKTAERMRSSEDQAYLEKLRSEQPGRFDDVRLVPPSLAFNDELRIDCGDLTLELFPTPGHQPDHIAVFIPEIGLLLAGDAAEEPFPVVSDDSDLPTLRASLARMAALNARQAFYCHAPVESGPQLIERNIKYFNLVEAYCAVALETGLSLPLSDDADLESLVGLPLANVLPAHISIDSLEDYYPPSHRTTIRKMCDYLINREES